MTTKIIPISDLRRKTSEVIREVREGGDAIYVTQHGRPSVVLVNYEAYEAIQAQLEDIADLASLKEAVNETDRPYDEIMSELGLPD
ncbi:MAG: type II toxin-antitoxin system Phd/YefM family antitoxin [Chloroflexi bacterium]|nr:type II toxin-antitoxin system Phd/YefM family antitoxin [Chloroflexota bacterium]MBU1661563.1 type II toxin-antitoxin system Phd/YefM family antitoxin [Chloroflexota bacterium]